MINISLKDSIKVRIMIGEKGYSLRGFAKNIEISQSYLSQILSEKRNPSAHIANKIAKGLNVKIDDIFFIEIDNKSYQKGVSNSAVLK